MSCNRLLAAGGVVLLLTGCGAKGPPRPPLSRAPQNVRDLFVRQAGNAIELRWSRPRARANGDPIEGPLRFRILARPLERAAVPAPAPPAGGSEAGTLPVTPGSGGAAGQPTPPSASAGSGTAAEATTTPGLAAPSAVPAPTPAPAPPNAPEAHANEDAFLRDAQIVAEIEETPEQAAAASATRGPKKAQGSETRGGEELPGKKSAQPPAADAATGATGATGAGDKDASRAAPAPPPIQYSVRLGPERFPGTQFSSVRLAFAVVAEDARGRRSHARPILEVDPVETPPQPSDLRAEGTTEGVALTWRLPEPPPAPPPSSTSAATAAQALGVDVYRAEASSPAPPSAAVPRFPYRPIPGSPFAGESALDRTAVIGASYVYEARAVSLAPGKGLRESVSSGTVAIAFKDVFAPGPPTLVTALQSSAGEPPSVHVAWSSPIEADVAGYRVYRAEGDGAFELAATVTSPHVEWTDTTVRRGARYRYTVAAIDAADPPNESVRSEEAEAIVPEEGA